MIVPFLRQDLQLLPGSSSEHGSPTWLLYDVLRNKYFSIGRTAFQLISNWSGGIDIDQFIKKIQLETNFYNVFRNTIRILFNDYFHAIFCNTNEVNKKDQFQGGHNWSLQNILLN